MIATKRIRFTTAEKIAYVKRAKKIPNPMPFEERDKLMDLAWEAEERGDLEKARAIRRKMPLQWTAALIWIEQYGAESLRESGWNLDWAVAVLGEELVYG